MTGQGFVVRQGDKLLVDLNISGLEPGLVHLQHIHGFGDPWLNTSPEFGFSPFDRPSQLPPPSAATIVPKTPDLLPGLISEHQGEVFTGPEMKDLTIGNDTMVYPAANAQGNLHYHQVLKAETSDGRGLGNLSWRVIEIHGAFVSGPNANGINQIVHAPAPGMIPAGATYNPYLPVAGGQLVPVRFRR